MNLKNIDGLTDMKNMERMTRFLNDVQGIFMQYNWAYPQPMVSSSRGEDDETPDDRLIDAHWITPKFELLLSVDDDGFGFYGDNYEKGKELKNNEPSPHDVAEALYLLQSS